MRQLDPDPVPEDDDRVILVAVRPSARFHRLGGIASLLVLYPAHDSLEQHVVKPVEAGSHPIVGGRGDEAA
ncbi:hypothetical protein [Aromatoleum petrolei]|uniref:Uncharacterized protein n=1 Tax=Aromatoleum petrolei TaxID=76116 RepID=A0ABX1MRJ7_9RHOO|nr:hypothetical protein [Aromatoleum petrolei]NMF87747.1 hypothetical protein [Aromatoleum petrolei]QTQ38236.1 Uncharacterized protein ToN1_41320 [Aromatoleum petrolei]